MLIDVYRGFEIHKTESGYVAKNSVATLYAKNEHEIYSAVYLYNV